MPNFSEDYSFDGSAITVSTNDPDRKAWAVAQRWVPCEHLKPLLAALVAKGAGIGHADSGWTQANLVITLSKGLSPGAAEAAAKARGLTFYENNDPHYLVARGCFCEACQQGLEWPQPQSVLDGI
ncbi:hypothetical protein D3C83_17220 [compost metagenome]